MRICVNMRISSNKWGHRTVSSFQEFSQTNHLVASFVRVDIYNYHRAQEQSPFWMNQTSEVKGLFPV